MKAKAPKPEKPVKKHPVTEAEERYNAQQEALIANQEKGKKHLPTHKESVEAADLAFIEAQKGKEKPKQRIA